ncbi:hypothetical protein EVG20_g716 [Dentipellis fragilis]|uniref:Uncharacterized protein n=1 Tax=Dentipellis fragilis TaxID=205917 RepID=A0A4Y9ZEJ8_9AGAM|nr:hypothetical protein EVG20_g716 [Dentipellis fragilis]
MASRYASELIYSLAFSSLAVHLLWQRRAADTERRRLGTQISILEEISTRLRVGERIPDAEYTRLRRLGHEGELLDKDGKEAEDIGWRDDRVWEDGDRAGEARLGRVGSEGFGERCVNAISLLLKLILKLGLGVLGSATRAAGKREGMTIQYVDGAACQRLGAFKGPSVMSRCLDPVRGCELDLRNEICAGTIQGSVETTCPLKAWRWMEIGPAHKYTMHVVYGSHIDTGSQ